MRIVLVVLLAVLSALTTLPAAAATQTDVRCFPETGQCISGSIRAYWERNGGLPVFGYPITPLATEALYAELYGENWTGPAQWFQRDRLEDHSAEGLGILAGRLGAQPLRTLTVSLVVPQPRPVAVAAPDCRLFPETQHTLCPPFRAYWEANGGLKRFG